MADELIKECEEVGLLADARDYLVARGFKKPGQIASVSEELSGFMTTVFEPFKKGMEITAGETKKKWIMGEGVDELVVQTGFKCLWKKCKYMERAEADKLKPQAKPAAFPPTPSIQVINTNEGNKERAPKKLGQGIWQKQIAMYEEAQSPPRLFPQKMIAGADEVLAQMLWEHETSKVYSELGLGEVIAVRMYDSCGHVNKYRNKNKGRDILGFKDVGGDEVEVVKKNEQDGTPGQVT